MARAGLEALVLVRGTVALVLAGAGPVVVHAQQSVTAAPSLVFDGVTVVDVEQGKLVPTQRVVITGNRIQAMGDAGAVKIPKDAQVVDARGKYLIPGLWDMHTHPSMQQETDLFYPLFIVNGVTGIRDAGSDVPVDTLILWRREILAGTRVGPPRQLLSGPAIDEGTSCTRMAGEEHICVDDAADARHVVDSLKAAGADMLKTYGLSPETYFAIAAEARRVGILFGGHLTAASASEASDSGASILDHPQAGELGDRCVYSTASVEQCQLLAEHFRRNNTWWVPTLMSGVASVDLHYGQWTWETLRLNIGPVTKTLLPRFSRLASAFWGGAVIHPDWLHDSASVDQATRPPRPSAATDSNGFMYLSKRVGLPILAGTDVSPLFMAATPPGFALHEELAMYGAEGLTPLEALQTATLNPTKFLHATDSLGTVASGKLADLVLLDANPLVDITNTTLIRAVVANGRYFDRAALDQLLAEVRAKAKQEGAGP
jgi:hypothetical protein